MHALFALTLLPLSSALSLPRDDSYTWSASGFTCPPTPSGCTYNFTLSAPAPPNANAGAPFAVTCSGYYTSPARPYASCAPADGGNASVVAAVRDAEDGTGALVQISYLYQDMHCQSWNYTGSYTLPSLPRGDGCAEFEVTPGMALMGFTSSCLSA